MKYRGRVQNGMVVLENAPDLKEGTVGDVEPVKPQDNGPRAGSAETILRHAGIWADEADEVDRLLGELHDMKQANLRYEQDQASLSNAVHRGETMA